jgi:hypothetical protein
MKRFLTTLAVAMLAVALLVGAGPAQAEMRDMWAEVYSWDGKMNGDGTMALTRITSGVTFAVLQADSDTYETLYYYAVPANTALTNPVTTTNFASDTVCKDMVAFRVDPGHSGDEYVDVIVTNTAGGYTAFVENFDRYTHAIVIDERPNVVHHGMIPFAFYATATEIDTGIDFDYDTAVHEIAVEVVTIDASETLNVGILSSGTAGDADGLAVGVPLDTAGYYSNNEPTITAATETAVTTASYVGALMGSSLVGDQGTATDEGSHYTWDHHVISANEQSLTYTPSTSDTAAGFIHYFFTRMR